MSKCKIDGCEVSKIHGYGMCDKHYRRYKNGLMDVDGNLFKPKVRARIFAKNCQIDGCNNDSIVKGYCLEHYRNYMLKLDCEKMKSSDDRYKALIGKTNIIPEIKKHVKHIEEYELKELPIEYDNLDGDGFCKMKECMKANKAKGFCDKHYYHYSNGSLDINGNWTNGVKEYQYKECQLVGCNEMVHGKGLCNKHLKLVTRGQIIIKGFDLSGYKKCKIDGCEKITESKGFCPAHYMRHEYGFIDINGKQLKEHIRDRNELDIETCLVGGCNNKHLSKGLCSKHYFIYLRRYNEEWLRQKFFSNN